SDRTSCTKWFTATSRGVGLTSTLGLHPRIDGCTGPRLRTDWESPALQHVLAQKPAANWQAAGTLVDRHRPENTTGYKMVNSVLKEIEAFVQCPTSSVG